MGEPAATVTSLESGSLVDHFQIRRLLGRGGMGEVYLARDTRLGRKYAATDIGDHLSIDLTAFHVGYCVLLRELWATVPVVWEGGRPVRRAPPPGHRCAR